MSDDLHTIDPRAAALQIEHHPAGAWLVALLKSPPPEAARVRLRGRWMVSTWSAEVAPVEGTGVCVGPADVVALAGLLVTRSRSQSGPWLRLDWLDGTGAPLPGSRSWSPDAIDPGPVEVASAPHAVAQWGHAELASDVIRAQADLQRAHAATIAAGVRELAHGHASQVDALRRTVGELQSIIIAQSADLRQMAGAAMKHESRGAARAYELALEHVQKAHEVQLQSVRADSGDMTLALAAELGPPLVGLARDLAAVRQGQRPPSAIAAPAPATTTAVAAPVRLDAAQLEAAVLAVIRDAARGNDDARAIVSRVVGSLSAAEKMQLGPLLLG